LYKCQCKKTFYLPRRVGYIDVMELFINGETAHVSPGLTVLELLDQRSLKAQEVVVERNRALVSKDAFAETVLEPGDSLEILHFVGGG
jgi:thiamine biosynthesis protein ThiS